MILRLKCLKPLTHWRKNKNNEPLIIGQPFSESVWRRDTGFKWNFFNFYPGEFVVIIGPSGAGKSTFIRCINRLVSPSEGEIIFDGQHLEKLSGRKLRKERSKIGMIFQHYNLVGRTNVIKNVLHGQYQQHSFIKSSVIDEDKKEAVELLKKVGLEEQMYKRADELSGGQMQRVGICSNTMSQ